MDIRGKQLALAITLVWAFPASALADGFYATALLGASQQASESEPYGNNIAADADFPGKFDLENGTVGGIGIGYRFNERMRVEGRFGYRESSFNDRKLGTGARAGEEYILNGDIKSTSLTVEGFYDFPNKSSFTPYVKAGVGVSRNRYSARLGGAGVAAFDPFDGVVDGYYDNYADGRSTEFTWNVGFGSSFKLSERASIFAEYQYVSFGDAKTGQDAFSDGFRVNNLAAHEVMIGLRVNF